jgi:hypothetical protein
VSLWCATAADVLTAAPRGHLDILGRDVRVALRGMLSRPAHTLAAVGAVALGIGASVAMFTVIDGVLLAPLDYHDAGRLVFVGETPADGRGGNTGYLSFVDLKTRARSLSHLAAATQSTATFTGEGQDAERVNAMRVSADYFPMIGVAGHRPRVRGGGRSAWRRAPRDPERRPLAPPLQADPAIAGRFIDLSGEAFTVVGVMPAGFDDLVASRLYVMPR